MEVLDYLPFHHEACLAILDSNTPQFFQPAERESFAQFLQNPNCTYLVMEHDDAIVGCGGFYLDNSKTQAHLRWGMIHYNAQRQGLGRFLLLYRIREIGKAGDVESVSLQTSPVVASFYEKQGFKRVQPTHHQLVDMVMKLTVCP